MTLTNSPAILLRPVCTLFISALLFTGCQAPPPRELHGPAAESTARELVPLPPLPVAGSTHYVVDRKESDVRILVFRGGPLAKVGHNHVVRVHDLSGDIYLSPQFHQSGFSLAFPVAALQVDPPEARADEGAEFAVMPSPQAIDATYKNMTGPALLDAQQFPEITLRSVEMIGPEWGPEVTVRVTLRGVERDLIVPLAVHSDHGALTVTGTFSLQTSDFGMTPFSVLGGGLQVLDEVKIRAHIVAHRVN